MREVNVFSLQAVIVDGLWPLFVVIWPGHVSLTLSLVNHEDDLSSYLSAQESRLVESYFFELWEILWWLDKLD